MKGFIAPVQHNRFILNREVSVLSGHFQVSACHHEDFNIFFNYLRDAYTYTSDLFIFVVVSVVVAKMMMIKTVITTITKTAAAGTTILMMVMTTRTTATMMIMIMMMLIVRRW